MDYLRGVKMNKGWIGCDEAIKRGLIVNGRVRCRDNDDYIIEIIGYDEVWNQYVDRFGGMYNIDELTVIKSKLKPVEELCRMMVNKVKVDGWSIVSINERCVQFNIDRGRCPSVYHEKYEPPSDTPEDFLEDA